MKKKDKLDEEQIQLFWKLADIEKYGCAEVKILNGKDAYVGYFRDPETLTKAISHFNGTHNIYFGRSPRPLSFMDTEAGNKMILGHSGAKNTDIEWLTSFVMDIDPTSAERPSTDEEYQTAIGFAKKIQEAHKGSAIIGSGNGAYIWMPIQPIRISDKNRERLNNQLNVFETWGRSFLKESHLEDKLRIDKTQDWVRVYRIPETLNVKRQGENDRVYRKCEIFSPYDFHVVDGLAQEIVSIQFDEEERGNSQQKKTAHNPSINQQRVSIEDVCRYYGFELKPYGGKLRGVCPIHPGATNELSFMIDPEKGQDGMFYCHSSEHEHRPKDGYYKTGSPIQLIMTKEKVSWSEALKVAREHIMRK